VDPQERPAVRVRLALQQTRGVFDQIVAQIPRIGDRDGAVVRTEGGQQQVFLGLPAQVERRLADAGAACDGLEAEP